MADETKTEQLPDTANGGPKAPKPDTTEKRGPGRPPLTDAQRAERATGGDKKPSMSDAMLNAGCESFARFCWLISAGIARLVGYQLPKLTPDEIREGGIEARNLMARAPWMIIVLQIIGFPFWLIRTAVSKAERIAEKQPAAPLSLVPKAEQKTP